MKKRTITLLILLFITAAVCWRGLQLSESHRISDSSEADGNAKISGHRADFFGKPDGRDRGPSPRQLGNPSGGLSGGAKSAPKSFGARISGEVQAGETLVMGGYRLPDGTHAFTFITPSSVRMEDGSEAIVLKTRAMATTPDQARSLGMDSLVTQDSTADHQAEAWSAQETASMVLKTTSTGKGTPWMITPSLMVKPGEPATIRIDGRRGAPSYSVEATVRKTADGNFSIQTEVVHTPDNQP